MVFVSALTFIIGLGCGVFVLGLSSGSAHTDRLQDAYEEGYLDGYKDAMEAR